MTQTLIWGTARLLKSEQNMLPGQKIDMKQIVHLSASQQSDLLRLLDKYPQCFSDDPGFCNLAQHEINLLPGFKPKRLKAYCYHGSWYEQWQLWELTQR